MCDKCDRIREDIQHMMGALLDELSRDPAHIHEGTSREALRSYIRHTLILMILKSEADENKHSLVETWAQFTSWVAESLREV